MSLDPVWTAFGCGMFLGTLLGVFLLSLLVSRRADDDLPRMGPPRIPR